MRAITLNNVLYTQTDPDTFVCCNNKTGKIWTVNRLDNPLGYAEVCEKLVWKKDKAAGMTYQQHVAACNSVAMANGHWHLG